MIFRSAALRNPLPRRFSFRFFSPRRPRQPLCRHRRSRPGAPRVPTPSQRGTAWGGGWRGGVQPTPLWRPPGRGWRWRVAVSGRVSHTDGGRRRTGVRTLPCFTTGDLLPAPARRGGAEQRGERREATVGPSRAWPSAGSGPVTPCPLPRPAFIQHLHPPPHPPPPPRCVSFWNWNPPYSWQGEADGTAPERRPALSYGNGPDQSRLSAYSTHFTSVNTGFLQREPGVCTALDPSVWQ